MNIASTITNQAAQQAVRRLAGELVEKRPKLPNNFYPQEVYHPYGESPPYEHFVRGDCEAVSKMLQADPQTSLTELAEAKARGAEKTSRKSAVFAALGLVAGVASVGLFAAQMPGAGFIGLAAGGVLGGLSLSSGLEASKQTEEGRLLGLWDHGLKNPDAPRAPVEVSIRTFREIFDEEQRKLGKRP